MLLSEVIIVGLDDEWWTAIWHECKTQSVAGELLDVCICTLSIEISVADVHWSKYLPYAEYKKSQSSENCAKVPMA